MRWREKKGREKERDKRRKSKAEIDGRYGKAGEGKRDTSRQIKGECR